MAQSVETAARRVSGSNLGHSLLFGQNLGICISCERIGKKIEDYVNTSLRKCNNYIGNILAATYR